MLCWQVMGNLVMEKLLPSLEKDLLPRLKAKRTEKKRVWFAVSSFSSSYIGPSVANAVLTAGAGGWLVLTLLRALRRWRRPTSWLRSTCWRGCRC